MNGEALIAAMNRGLPQLRGRLLWSYRGIWTLLAAATVATLASTLLDGTMQPWVLGIRLVKSAILIAVAAVLFWKRPRDPVAAILGLAFLCWTITSSVDFTSAEVLPMVLDRLRFLLFALALLLFPDGKWRPRWTRQVAVVSIIVFMLGVVEAIGIQPTRLFLPLAIVCVIAAISSLIQRFRRTSSETQQQQLKWVSFGLVTGVSLILTARACAFFSSPAVAFEAMFQLGIVVVALGFLVPLLRYRLYDAEAVISRSVGYAVLTAALVATFAGTEALIELLGQRYLGSSIGQASGAIAAALAAVLLAPLNERTSKWSEHHFQRDLVHLKRHLPELLAQIPASWSPRQIGAAVLPQFVEAIHATRAAVTIDGKVIAAGGCTIKEAKRFRNQFPLELRLHSHFGQLRGALLLGARPDMTTYGKDEREAVEVVLPSLSRVILASLERAKAHRRTSDSERRIGARLSDLSMRMEALERVSSQKTRSSRRHHSA